MTQIPLSVVMSVYNGAAYIQAALDSVLHQTHVDFEFIVIDDGSTDATAEILQDSCWTDSRIKLIRQENRGLTKSLIRGCAAAQGTFIARQDADDISHPDRLQQQVMALREDPELSFVSCWSRAIGPADELLYETQGSQDAKAARDDLLSCRASPCHGSVMFRRAIYEAVGGYRAQFRLAQDLDLWLRMAAAGKFFYLPELL